MKQKPLYSFALCSILGALCITSARAEAEPPKNVAAALPNNAKTISIRITLIGIILGENHQLSIDIAAGNRVTVGMFGSYRGAKLSQELLDVGSSAWSNEIGMSLDYYLTGSRLTSSWIVSPQVGLTFAKIEHQDDTNSIAGFRAQLTAGRISVMPFGLTIRSALGVTYGTLPTSVAVNGAEATLKGPGIAGWGFVAQSDVGWAF